MAGNDIYITLDPSIINDVNIDLPAGDDESLRDHILANRNILFVPVVQAISNRKELRLFCQTFPTHLNSLHGRFTQMFNDSLQSLNVAREEVETMAATTNAVQYRIMSSSRSLSSMGLNNARQLSGEAFRVLLNAINLRVAEVTDLRDLVENNFTDWIAVMQGMLSRFNEILGNVKIDDAAIQHRVGTILETSRNQSQRLLQQLLTIKFRNREQTAAMDGKIMTTRKLLHAARNAEVLYHMHSTQQRNSATVTTLNALAITYMETLIEPELLLERGCTEILSCLSRV